MRYCKRCVLPDTRPYLKFDEEGICYPCRVQEKIEEIDWDQRWGELEELADKYRGTNGDYYDCMITASGGKDSHLQTYIFKEKLGMNPLVVSIDNFSWTETGRQNWSNLLTRFGVDAHLFSLSSRVSIGSRNGCCSTHCSARLAPRSKHCWAGWTSRQVTGKCCWLWPR